MIKWLALAVAVAVVLPLGLVLLLTAGFTVAMGVWPEPIVAFARHAGLLF